VRWLICGIKIKKIKITNMVHAALLRAIWLLRNDMYFNRATWPGMQMVWRKTAWLLAQWEVILPVDEKGSERAFAPMCSFGN
jgi:hypothetical protein